MSRNDTSPPSTASGPPGPPETSTPARDRQLGDDLAAWTLRGPLALALGGLVAVQLATWIPHYLTWPFWTDHDVFATLARAWDLGQLPYRDLQCNNFPGTIYLFWVLGKAFGWGRTLPLYAFDAGLVVALGVALVAWSRRRLGAALPGLVGYLTFLTYYLGLDYSQSAQRDWHGPCFAVLGLLAAEGWPGRVGRFASALAFALAVTFRPQTVLLLPALALAIDESARPPGEPVSRTFRALLGWGGVFAALVALAFLPLWLAGIADDFARGIRLTAYGGRYNRVTASSALRLWLFQLAPLRMAIVPAVLALLAGLADSPSRRMALTWGVALGGISLYKPLSPYAHGYLTIPLTLLWSVSLAAVAHLVLASRRPAPALQLVAVLTILSLGTTLRPDDCALGQTLRGLATLRRGGMPEEPPYGYRPGAVPGAAYYAWSDYRAVLEYLRRETGPETRVANALKGFPAITGPSDRRSAFPAEAMTWLEMVNPDDAPRFAEALGRRGDAVAIWSPGETGPDPNFHAEAIERAIRDHFRPEARFGAIEVWRKVDGVRTGSVSPDRVRTIAE